MRKINRKCVICGKEYSYCNSCGEDINKPAWYSVFCSENCRKIYNAVAAVYAEQMTKAEAKVILDTCDLSNQEHYTDSTKTMIKEIYTESKIKESKEKLNTVVVQDKEAQSIKNEIEKPVTVENNKSKYEQPKPVFKPKNKKNR